MILLLAGAASAAIAGGSGAPPSLFDAFQSFCATSNADPKPALGAADAAGWQALPAGAAPPAIPHFKFDSFAGRFKQTGNGFSILVAGAGQTDDPAGGTRASQMCLVMTSPSEPASLDRARAWLPVDPMVSKPELGTWVYAFKDTAAGRVKFVAPTPSPGDASPSPPKVVIIYASPNGQAAMLGYIVADTAATPSR